jgi:hypothetical protein
LLLDCVAWLQDTAAKLEARVRIELTIEVLQTSALPLGYRAGWFIKATRQNDTLKLERSNEKPSQSQGFRKTGAGDGD